MDRPNAATFCDELTFNRFHWTLLLLGGLTLVCDGYDSQILSYVMPHVIKEWHVSPVKAGSVVSYGLAGLMIGTAGLGMLADRIGRKIPLILGLAAICGPLFGGFLQSAGFSFSHFFALIAAPYLFCAILVLFYRVNVRGEGLETVEAELTTAGVR